MSSESDVDEGHNGVDRHHLQLIYELFQIDVPEGGFFVICLIIDSETPDWSPKRAVIWTEPLPIVASYEDIINKMEWVMVGIWRPYLKDVFFLSME